MAFKHVGPMTLVIVLLVVQWRPLLCSSSAALESNPIFGLYLNLYLSCVTIEFITQSVHFLKKKILILVFLTLFQLMDLFLFCCNEHFN